MPRSAARSYNSKCSLLLWSCHHCRSSIIGNSASRICHMKPSSVFSLGLTCHLNVGRDLTT